MSRPENQAPPEIFYNDEEALKYSTSSRMQKIQVEMSERAIELLALPEETNNLLILDLGCGSGLSGECLTESGLNWIGLDISKHMIEVAKEREVEGELILGDMGNDLPFRDGIFDGAISISALQWLCWSNKSSENPINRLRSLFNSLYRSLKRGTRAVFQLYPDSPEQVSLVTETAMRAGFGGGLVIDYPNSAKAKKYYLTLFCGPSTAPMPKALGSVDAVQVAYGSRETQRHNKKQKHNPKSKDWVMRKKEKQRAKGQEIKRDSKYTARKRPTPF